MIILKHVSYAYNHTPVLHDLCCEIPDAAMTAIIGANGAGKSTCLKLCAGLLGSTSDIFIDDMPIQSLAPKERARHISYMPQNRPVSMLTVYALARQGRYPHPQKPNEEQIIQNALRAVQMESLAERRLDTLSGGQCQRAYFAMLLAQDTRNILLDEPTASLDIRAQLECLSLLQELRGQGRCILIAMHDLRQAIEYCDRIVLLRDGRIYWQGRAREIPMSALREAFSVEPSYKSCLTFSLFPKK